MLYVQKVDLLVLVCKLEQVFNWQKNFFNTQDNNVKPNETTTSTTTDTTARLKQLKQLFDEELITEEEYKKKKNEILDTL